MENYNEIVIFHIEMQKQSVYQKKTKILKQTKFK